MISHYPVAVEQAMRYTYGALNERQRRFYAAAEAMKLGHGGIAYIAELLDCHRRTVERGLEELRDPKSLAPPCRARNKGGPPLPDALSRNRRPVLGCCRSAHRRRSRPGWRSVDQPVACQDRRRGSPPALVVRRRQQRRLQPLHLQVSPRTPVQPTGPGNTRRALPAVLFEIQSHRTLPAGKNANVWMAEDVRAEVSSVTPCTPLPAL